MNSHEQERLFKRLRDDLIDASRKLVDAGAKITDRPP